MTTTWITQVSLQLPGKPAEIGVFVYKADKVVEWIPESANKSIPMPDHENIVIDGQGLWLVPGLIDLHVHLRDPGLTYKEDIASGTQCAVASGVTAVVALANTDPVNDSPEVTRYILERAQETAYAKVLPVSAATIGLAGHDLAPYHRMKEAGCIAVSDDGNTVPEAGVMRRVLEYAASVNMPVLPHCEDRTVRAGGVMNAGPIAASLGLPGNPRQAEEIALARDISLAELSGGHLHVQHLTTAGGVDMVRRAKDAGIRITSEVCPHHLFLTDEAVVTLGTHAKMAPPLRTARDVEALRTGLADGTIDVLATDHAPHAPHEKDLPFEAAPDGIIGLETLLPLALKLVQEGVMPLSDLLERMITAPTKILGLDETVLAPGSPADFSLIDPEISWTYDAADGCSKSRNSPFDQWTFNGRVVATFVDGQCRWNTGSRADLAKVNIVQGVKPST